MNGVRVRMTQFVCDKLLDDALLRISLELNTNEASLLMESDLMPLSISVCGAVIDWRFTPIHHITSFMTKIWLRENDDDIEKLLFRSIVPNMNQLIYHHHNDDDDSDSCKLNDNCVLYRFEGKTTTSSTFFEKVDYFKNFTVMRSSDQFPVSPKMVDGMSQEHLDRILMLEADISRVSERLKKLKERCKRSNSVLNLSSSEALHSNHLKSSEKACTTSSSAIEPIVESCETSTVLDECGCRRLERIVILTKRSIELKQYWLLHELNELMFRLRPDSVICGGIGDDECFSENTTYFSLAVSMAVRFFTLLSQVVKEPVCSRFHIVGHRCFVRDCLFPSFNQRDFPLYLDPVKKKLDNVALVANYQQRHGTRDLQTFFNHAILVLGSILNQFPTPRPTMSTNITTCSSSSSNNNNNMNAYKKIMHTIVRILHAYEPHSNDHQQTTINN